VTFSISNAYQHIEEQDKPSISEENAMRSDLVFGALANEPLYIDRGCREGSPQVSQTEYPYPGNCE
jgi:hypothetical protein